MGMGQGEWVKGTDSALGGSCWLASSGGPPARRCLWVRLCLCLLPARAAGQPPGPPLLADQCARVFVGRVIEIASVFASFQWQVVRVGFGPGDFINRGHWRFHAVRLDPCGQCVEPKFEDCAVGSQ